MDGTVSLGSVPVTANAASLSISSLSVGTHSLTAVYSGDANVNGNTSAAISQTVSKASTTTVVTPSPKPAIVNRSVTLTALVSGKFGGVPSGTVIFRSGNLTLGSAVLSNGSAVFTTTFTSAGTRSITAIYSGDVDYTTSTSATLSLPVTKEATTTVITSSLNPSNVGQLVTFTAAVSSSLGAPPDGESVSFRSGGTTLGTGTTHAGVATFSTSSLTVGTHNITAVYAGDSTFASSTSIAVSQVVNQYATSTAVVSNFNPSQYGQAVTFTATVTPIGTYAITGTVTFRSGTTTLATVTTTNGAASYTTSALTASAKSITAIYNGDSNNATSTSAVLIQTVNKATTTTTLTSSLNPSSFGQSVTFTATVTSAPGVTPTGSVTFRRGTTSLGTVSLSASGIATVRTSSLPRGNDTISATYNGTANFATSTVSLVKTVN